MPVSPKLTVPTLDRKKNVLSICVIEVCQCILVEKINCKIDINT